MSPRLSVPLAGIGRRSLFRGLGLFSASAPARGAASDHPGLAHRRRRDGPEHAENLDAAERSSLLRNTKKRRCARSPLLEMAGGRGTARCDSPLEAVDDSEGSVVKDLAGVSTPFLEHPDAAVWRVGAHKAPSPPAGHLDTGQAETGLTRGESSLTNASASAHAVVEF